MTLGDAMQETYLLATGKPTLPPSGSTKYNRLYRLCIKFYRDWQREPGVDWNSLYGLTTAGTVTATDTFEFDDEVIKVSQRAGDFVRVLVTSPSTYRDFTLIPASQLYQGRYTNAVAKIGQTVKFSRTFASTDPEFGKTIYVPAYIALDDLLALTDDVLIDDPSWLPPISAAQYVLSDAQLNYQYPDLLQQAQDRMDAMRLANNTQGDTYATGQDFFYNGLGNSAIRSDEYYA